MANSNNWGEIYNSTWWGDKAWSANTLFIDSAPPGFGLNLLKGSEDLDNTIDWKQVLSSVVANSTDEAAPNSTDTAEKITFTADRQSRIQQQIDLEANTTYTFSVYAKVRTGTKAFRLRNSTLGQAQQFTADTSWGLNPDDGRYSFSFTTGATAITHTLSIQNAAAGGSGEVFFWGAMLNEGATAGDYVKTEASVSGSAPTPAYSGFGDAFGGVTAYYSLRQFTEAETLNAIRVRRSSDDTEQDIGFDANGDLDTTALTTFVNADVDIYTSDFTSGNEDMAEVNGTGADGQSIAGVDDAYKFTLSGGAVAHYTRTDSAFDRVNSYDVSFDYYIPSGQTIDGIRVRTGTTSDGEYDQTTLDAWTSVAIENWTPTSKSTCRFNALVGSSIDPIDADGDVFYLKNIVITQTTADGAVTTFYDQTGNGNHATNATESEQPLVVSGGSVVTENGKAAIEFDGVDDELTIPSSTSSFNYLHNGSNAALMVVGSIVENDANFGIVVNNGRTTSKTGYALQFEDRSAVSASRRIKSFATKSVGGQFVFTNQTADNAIDNDTQFLIIDIIDADNTTASDRSELYIDGGSAIKNNTSTNAPTSADATEDMSFFQTIDGKAQELIVFNSDQSTNRTGIESNINDHFTIYP